MDRPFFSVIVPAHNSANYIGRGLNSIKRQTFRDYELIVVCDSCNDETPFIALNNADKTLIRDFHHDGLARNAGLDVAEGEWVLWMDDDDWWLHEFVFQQIYEMAGKHGEDILAFSFIWKNERYYRQEWDHQCVAVWNKCWKREFIGDTRFTDREWGCDAEFHNKMFRKSPIVYYWDMPMYYYNFMRPGSQTWDMKKRGRI